MASNKTLDILANTKQTVSCTSTLGVTVLRSASAVLECRRSTFANAPLSWSRWPTLPMAQRGPYGLPRDRHMSSSM